MAGHPTRKLIDKTDGTGPLRRVTNAWNEGGHGSGNDLLLTVTLECNHEKLYLHRKVGSAPKRARCSVCKLDAQEGKQENARDRSAKVSVKIRAGDGSSLSTKGNFPERTAFGVYMLLCDWGDGKAHKPLRKKAVREFEAAAKAFLEASERYMLRSALKRDE